MTEFVRARIKDALRCIWTGPDRAVQAEVGLPRLRRDENYFPANEVNRARIGPVGCKIGEYIAHAVVRRKTDLNVRGRGKDLIREGASRMFFAFPGSHAAPNTGEQGARNAWSKVHGNGRLFRPMCKMGIRRIV